MTENAGIARSVGKERKEKGGGRRRRRREVCNEVKQG